MSVWLIEPFDPLIARDGRPSAVGRFDTTSFPFPSMVAGAVRTRMGSVNGAFALSGSALDELKERVHVRGPLLAELNPDDGAVEEWLAPAPRDAVVLEEEGAKPEIRRLAPRSLALGETLDSFQDMGLLPLRLHGSGGRGKPPQGIPAFWRWSRFESWLRTPVDEPGIDVAALGACRLPVEIRAHLAIQPGERVGLDGMLFQTSGLRFLYEGPKGTPRLAPRRLALSLWSQGATVAGRDLELAEQLAPLGGERRLARWSRASRQWPRLPPDVLETIVETGRARLILLTPAIFAQGALPGWNGTAATVRAAAVPRPEIVSGWDLAAGRPKKTRRLAPAGSVYFVELAGAKLDFHRWCEETWLNCVSDDAQDRRDGFGLAALGTWKEDAQ
ncbi:MAG TPA: type III-B CRISPR module-associated protein Cmr3 [Thermoanaerobaculia bacterium]|nr:type III-B CRISPR module-associated protein Cmr3 [Thermoanaerobaculia bacterium]